MTEKTTFTVRYRRRRAGRTDYKKRLKLLLSQKPRIIIRKQSKQIMLQLAEFDPKGDRIIATVTSTKLKKYGWKYSHKNIPAAYLTGMLLAKAVKKAKKTEAVADIGLHPNIKGSKIYAAIKGAKDAGLNISCSEDIMPSEDRIKGQHILANAKNIESKGIKQQFSKTKVNNLTEDFEAIKKKIQSE